MLESAGIPLPGETVLIAAGFMVHQGYLDPGDAIIFGILGAIVGDQIGYWVGRKGGRPFVLRWGRYVLITPERLEHAQRFFRRHGGKAVFLARFVAGLRVFGALLAGISRMRWRTFFFYNAIGGATWATTAVLLGYFVGGSFDLVVRGVGRSSALVGILLVFAVVLYLAYRWASRHPEQLRSVGNLLGGDYLRTFLQTPLGRWIKRRFSPREALGLTLTIGLVFTALFSWVFGGVVQDVVAQDPLVRTDVVILRFVYSHGDPTLTALITLFEALFSPELLLSVGALAGVLFTVIGYRRKDFRLSYSGVVLLATIIGTGVLAELFKLLFHRPRPPASLQLVPEVGYGFPSSHALAAVAVGGALWYVYSLRPQGSWGGSWRAKARVGFIVCALALLVGLGRVYMGAHYPSDVLAGWALGGVWTSICLTAAEVVRRIYENGSRGSRGLAQCSGPEQPRHSQDDDVEPPHHQRFHSVLLQLLSARFVEPT